MAPEDRVRLQHMLDAASTAIEFVSQRKKDDLANDKMLLFAVLRAIEVLGEAAGKVSHDTQSVACDIPWRAMVGMRNRLIHGYFDIDTEVVWQTVTRELPALIPRIQRALAAPA